MDPLEYRTEDTRFSCIVPRKILEQARELCQHSYPDETGGILVGYYEDSHTAIITKATKEPLGSEHHPLCFYRAKKGLIPFLDKCWKKGEYYLGEWHYHPGGSPIPSATDVQAMAKIAQYKKLRCPEPLLIIIGGKQETGWLESVSVFTEKCSYHLFPVTK